MREKILIVDDSMFIRNTLKNLLSNEYDVIEADCGADGILKYVREEPDLVLLDIIMPDGTLEGVNVINKIRIRDPKAKVIMITAVGQEQIVNECKEAGASDYIVKPFDESFVVEKVRYHLKK